MIVAVKKGADVARVRAELGALGLWTTLLEPERAEGGFLLEIERHSRAVSREEILRVEGVEGVSAPKSAHPLVDAHGLVVKVGDLEIGRAPFVAAGPCAVESEAQIFRIARALSKEGVGVLRGGAFKPRTSPYSFQGRGVPALGWLRDAARAHGMKVVTEAMSELDVPAVAEVADLVQVGSRSMQSFALLRAVGGTKKPVLLKRGMSATIEEWLLAAEYLLSSGAPSVVFCERGVRGFDPSARNLVDVGAIALLRHALGLPAVVDPSHGAGRRDLVVPLARAALAAGAVGVLVEVHDDPGNALSDGPQALPIAEVGAIVRAAEEAMR